MTGRRVLGAVAWPCLWLGAVVGAWAWVRAAGDPATIVLVVGGAAVVATAALEWLLPFRRAWWPDRQILRVDGLHLVISSWLIESLPTIFAAALVAAGASLESQLGIGLWPQTLGLEAQVGAALLLGTFNNYVWHRASHEVPWLWRFHAVHHSSDRIYWLNATRVHVGEALVITALGPGLLVLLGTPVGVLAIVACAEASYRVVQHSNIDFDWGPTHWLINHSQQHRWHHSVRPDEADANYGTMFAIWDQLFGTWRRFTGEAPVALGVGGRLPYPATYRAQLVAPLAWNPDYVVRPLAEPLAQKEQRCE